MLLNAPAKHRGKAGKIIKQHILCCQHACFVLTLRSGKALPCYVALQSFPWFCSSPQMYKLMPVTYSLQ